MIEDGARITFRLAIHCDTSAFADDDTAASANCDHEHGQAVEVARILRKLADQLERGEDFSVYRTLYDHANNDVGRAAFKPDETASNPVARRRRGKR